MDHDVKINALDNGLWRRVIVDDEIDVPAWNRLRAERGLVGTCRLCGGHLSPISVERYAGVDWYEAICLLCGKEIVAPDGRTLRRSGRHSEMPPGWWEQRVRALGERER